MPDPDPTTPVSVIRERLDEIRTYADADSQFFRPKLTCAVHVPLLLCAVERVLALHSLTAYSRHLERCPEHRTWAGIGLDRYEIEACPDCVTVERHGLCDCCRDEHGDPAPAEECEIRLAITSALLGLKEGTEDE
jgi:hypothetical protein